MSNFDPKELGEELPTRPSKPNYVEEYPVDLEPNTKPAAKLAQFRRVSLTLGKSLQIEEKLQKQ